MRNRSGRAVALLAAILVWGLVLPGPAAAAGIGPVQVRQASATTWAGTPGSGSSLYLSRCFHESGSCML